MSNQHKYELINGKYSIQTTTLFYSLISFSVSLLVKSAKLLLFFVIPFVITASFFSYYAKISASPEAIFTAGTVFATFGSAIITVVSLYCSDLVRRFCSNVSILQRDLLHSNDWERWPFLKRSHIFFHPGQPVKIYRLKNPRIRFSFSGDKDIWFYIPTTKEDFYDLPIIHSYMNIKKIQTKYILNNCVQNIQFQHEAMILNCVHSLYFLIIRYKLCQWLIFMNGCLIADGILFSFSWSWIVPKWNYLCSLFI